MYIRPHLDFCDVIYHIPCITNPFDSSINLNYLMNTLERIQYHAALAITGAWKGSNLNKIYEELGWESLTDRRYCRRLFHFYKIETNQTPHYMKDHLPASISHSYSTRSDHVLHEIKCNSDSYRASFYPDSVRCWNRLGDFFRNSINLNMFKSRLLSGYRPSPKSIFGIHDSLGIRRLFQLRVGLSPLLAHKRSHNFLDSPTDKCVTCDSSENPEHFFLYCTRFTEQRHVLLNSVLALYRSFELLQPKEKTKCLLYGDNSLNFATNRLLLIATLKFFKESERFT